MASTDSYAYKYPKVYDEASSSWVDYTYASDQAKLTALASMKVDAAMREETNRTLCRRAPEYSVSQECEAEKEYL